MSWTGGCMVEGDGSGAGAIPRRRVLQFSMPNEYSDSRTLLIWSGQQVDDTRRFLLYNKIDQQLPDIRELPPLFLRGMQ